MNRRAKDEYRKTLDVLKDEARWEIPPAWTDEEWRTILRRLGAPRTEAETPRRSFALRPLVSAAAALAVLIWGAVFVERTSRPQYPAGPEGGLPEIAARSPGKTVAPPEAQLGAPAERVVPRPASAFNAPALVASAARESTPREDKPAFTWISQETGLKIVWFTNENLKLEGFQ